MSQFLKATKNAIQRHGVDVTYKRVSVPVYNSYTGQATSTETAFTVKTYPRQIVATQYSLPNMIGKELIEFYIYAPDLSVAPKVNDKINMSGDYTVMRVEEHRVLSVIALYKLLAVKS